MTFKEIKELIELLNESNLAELKIKKNDFELNIRTEKFSKSSSAKAPISALQPNIAAMTTPGPAFESATEPSQADSDSSPTVESADAAKDENLLEIKSPIVGTFYRSSGPDKPPYVKIGGKIDVGSVVCVVEAMKLFNEIESEIAGTVVKVLVKDASPVEYDQPLFLVEG